VAISISDRLCIQCFGIFDGCPTHALSQGLDKLVELDHLRPVEARMGRSASVRQAAGSHAIYVSRPDVVADII
jgi:hypothetical protein